MLVGRSGVSVAEREAIVPCVEITAGGRAGRHTHPGDEISYVTAGKLQLLIDGPAPAGAVHDTVNATGVPVRLVGVYVIDNGKPLATPAP